MLYSIGHSNHDMKRFVELLKQHDICHVVDVRSTPYSQYSPQFNQPTLRCALQGAEIEYRYLGSELGGRPREMEFYDDEGHVLYDRLAQSAAFRGGLAQLEELGNAHRAAMMCSEEDPAVCHRFLLISRVLEDGGTGVRHIRGNGEVQTHAEIWSALTASEDDVDQLVLFDAKPDLPWKSLQSVLQRKARPSSSGR